MVFCLCKVYNLFLLNYYRTVRLIRHSEPGYEVIKASSNALNSKQVSWRTRALVVSDWMKRFIFGRDSSQI